MSIWKKLFRNPFQFFDMGKHSVKKEKSDSKSLMLCDITSDEDFAGSVVALAAKMAKADGIATIDEALAFEAAFPIDKSDKVAFEKLFNLAAGTTLGFEQYAKRIGRKYGNNRQILFDVMVVLFFVAIADGEVKAAERSYLEQVAKRLGLTESDFARIAAFFIKDVESNPYVVLGVHESDNDETIKKAWLEIVTRNHPDALMGRGVPKEFIKMANETTAHANAAYKTIRAERAKKHNISKQVAPA